GAPVAPSKKATRHPCSLQYARKAFLLAASAKCIFLIAVSRLWVSPAISAALRRFRVNAAFCPGDSSLGTGNPRPERFVAKVELFRHNVSPSETAASIEPACGPP